MSFYLINVWNGDLFVGKVGLMCGQISALIRLFIIAGDTCDGIPFRHRSVGGDAVIAASLVAGIAGRHSEWEQDAQIHNRVVSNMSE